MYNIGMDYHWDAHKAKINRRKHGVDFADAVTVLTDDYALTIEDESADGERRFITAGRDALGRVLLVVYTWRGETIRIISARKATGRERKQYEQEE